MPSGIVPDFDSRYDAQGVSAALRLFTGRVRVSGQVLSQIVKLLVADEQFMRSVGVEGPIEKFSDAHSQLGSHRRTAKLSEQRRTELLSLTPMGRAILDSERRQGGR